MENQAQPPEAAYPGRFYLDHVAALGQTREVLAGEDIFSRQGRRLIAKGARLDSEAFGRLGAEALRKPLDLSIAIEDGVTEATLVREVRQLIESDVQLEAMLAYLRNYQDPIRALGRVPLNRALTVKLTVARERTPQIFTHCVRVAIGAAILGATLRLSPDELGVLAAAGVFHDLGELHIDPALLDRSRPLSADERRQVYNHPVIAYRMLRDFPEYHPRVSRPVLEHHERADGSGYPSGLRGEAISRLGRVLALGELAAGVCERNSCDYLETLLKFQAEKYGPELVSPLAAALRGVRGKGKATAAQDPPLAEQLETIQRALAAWREPGAPAAGESAPAAQLVGEQLASLRHGFARIGIPSDALPPAAETLKDDAAALGELRNVAHEALFQLEELAHELRRRWPNLAGDSDPGARAVAAWIAQVEEPVGRALHAASAPASAEAPAASAAAAPPAPDVSTPPANRTVH
jgi:hypothetical protein